MKAYDLEHTGDGEDEANAMAAGADLHVHVRVRDSVRGREPAELLRLGNRAPETRRRRRRNWPLFCKIQFEKGGERGAGHAGADATGDHQLQCFELMFKGVVEL